MLFFYAVLEVGEIPVLAVVEVEELFRPKLVFQIVVFFLLVNKTC